NILDSGEFEEESPDGIDEPEFPLTEDIEEEENISLSEDELGNILESGEFEEEKLSPEEEAILAKDEKEPVSFEDLAPILSEGEEEEESLLPTTAAIAGVAAAGALVESEDSNKTTDKNSLVFGVNKIEAKELMEQLDELLANLPDALILEFSKSKHFETYKKLLEGLKENG
ncbi:MAG: hypothetical protein KDK45_23610, partial [Leptospiraceae bacterium]|nr:hypothetical protein [Leptospiraceae bacterium]